MALTSQGMQDRSGAKSANWLAKGSVIFYREGAPEKWEDQVLFLRSKGG